MSDRIDSLANLIRPSVYADPNKFFTNQNFEDNLSMDINVPGTPGGSDIAGLKSFINGRRNSLAPQISSFCTLANDELESEEFALYPNPAEHSFTIRAGTLKPSIAIVCDVTGKEVYRTAISNDYAFETTHWKPGIYFVKLSGFNKTEQIVILH